MVPIGDQGDRDGGRRRGRHDTHVYLMYRCRRGHVALAKDWSVEELINANIFVIPSKVCAFLFLRFSMNFSHSWASSEGKGTTAVS